jgi:hypothetical protein
VRDWIKASLAIVLMVLAGCASMTIRTDYDQDVDFAKYKTFDWLPKSGPLAPGRQLLNPFMEERVKSAIETQLASKGYVRETEGKPNFRIAIHAGARDQLNVTDYGYHYGPRGRWGSRYVEVYTYKEGTLILDFVDPRLQQLIWRGWAVGALAGPEQVEEQITDSVRRILDKFPPQ